MTRKQVIGSFLTYLTLALENLRLRCPTLSISGAWTPSGAAGSPGNSVAGGEGGGQEGQDKSGDGEGQSAAASGNSLVSSLAVLSVEHTGHDGGAQAISGRGEGGHVSVGERERVRGGDEAHARVDAKHLFVDAQYLLDANAQWLEEVGRDFPKPSRTSAPSAPAAAERGSTCVQGDAEEQVVRWTLEDAVARRLEKKKDKKGEQAMRVADAEEISLQGLSVPPGCGRAAPGPATPVAEPCAVHCGHDYSAIITSAGQLLTFGDNSSGKLGHARTEFDCGPSVTGHEAYLQPGLVTRLLHTRIVAVGCGDAHMAAVDANGSVYCWGRNSCGQCGLLHASQQILSPSRVRSFGSSGGGDGVGGLKDEVDGHGDGDGGVGGHAVAVACGDEFTIVLCEGGAVYAWGRNHEGQCGIGVTGPAVGCLSSPRRVMSSPHITCPRENARSKCKAGKGKGEGGAKGKKGSEKTSEKYGPAFTSASDIARGQSAGKGDGGLVPLINVVRIAAAAQQACAIVGDGQEAGEAGELVCWGCAEGGRLGVRYV